MLEYGKESVVNISYWTLLSFFHLSMENRDFRDFTNSTITSINCGVIEICGPVDVCEVIVFCDAGELANV